MRSIAFRVLVYFICAIGPSIAMHADSPVSESQEYDFFETLFMRVGNLDDRQELLERQMRTVIRHFHLNTQDATSLRSVAGEFRSGLQSVRQMFDAVKAGKSQLSDGDNAALADVIQQKRALVSRSTNRLLTSLTPIAARVLKDSAKANKR